MFQIKYRSEIQLLSCFISHLFDMLDDSLLIVLKRKGGLVVVFWLGLALLLGGGYLLDSLVTSESRTLSFIQL